MESLSSSPGSPQRPESLERLVEDLALSESERACLTPKWENVGGSNSLIRAIKYAGMGIYVAVRRTLFRGTNNERQVQKLSRNISHITAVVGTGDRPEVMKRDMLENAIGNVRGALEVLGKSGVKPQAMQQIQDNLYDLECAALYKGGESEALRVGLVAAASEGDPSAAFVLYEHFSAEGSLQNAIYYLKKAAGENYVPALIALAERHRLGVDEGHEIQRDANKAYDLLKKAADLQTPKQEASSAGEQAKRVLGAWPGEGASASLLAIWSSPFVTLDEARRVADAACLQDPQQVSEDELRALELCRDYYDEQAQDRERDKYKLFAERAAYAKAETLEDVARLADAGNRVAQVAYFKRRNEDGWSLVSAYAYLTQVQCLSL